MSIGTDVAPLRPEGNGRFTVPTDPRFWNQIGPFGGWLAAVALQAMRAEADPAFLPRSTTVHYFGALGAGTITIQVTTLRVARTIAALRAELSQGGQVAVTADALFGRDRGGPTLGGADLPALAAPDAYPRWHGVDHLARFVRQFDYRVAFGEAFTAGPAGVSGGWIKLDGGGAVGPEQMLLLADAWYPPIWATLSAPAPVSTLSMTVAFRGACDAARNHAHDFIGARHRTERVADGYAEERGELWLPDGTLALQTQQVTWIDLAKAHRQWPQRDDARRERDPAQPLFSPRSKP